MPLRLTPHTFLIYKPVSGTSGNFVGKPTYTLRVAASGLLEPKGAGELFRTWGVEIAHGAEALIANALGVVVDDRLKFGTTWYRVLAVMPHTGTHLASHDKLLLERLDNV